MRRPFPRFDWRTLIARHLFGYLTVLAAIVVLVSVVLARDELSHAMAVFDARWVPLVLGLSVFNYGLRFAKWHRLLKDSGISVPLLGNARLYFACLAMVVTPARLGELYKVVFLRRLYGVSPERSLPPLVLERVTDALAVLALVAAQPFDGPVRIASVAVAIAGLVLVGWGLSNPRWRSLLMRGVNRIGVLQRRAAGIERGISAHARLLRPGSFAPNLALSAISWWAECLGLWVICWGLGEAIGVGDATWIYALSTLLGNLTFLPGGLGGTEVSLFALLRAQDVSPEGAVAATALVRAATLWFAVGIGLVVTWIFRRHLHWKEVTEEASTAPLTARAGSLEGDAEGRGAGS